MRQDLTVIHKHPASVPNNPTLQYTDLPKDVPNNTPKHEPKNRNDDTVLWVGICKICDVPGKRPRSSSLSE